MRRKKVNNKCAPSRKLKWEQDCEIWSPISLKQITNLIEKSMYVYVRIHPLNKSKPLDQFQ